MKRKRRFTAGDTVHYWPYGFALQPYKGVISEVKYNRHQGFVYLVTYTDSREREKENWILQRSLTRTI